METEAQKCWKQSISGTPETTSSVFPHLNSNLVVARTQQQLQWIRNRCTDVMQPCQTPFLMLNSTVLPVSPATPRQWYGIHVAQSSILMQAAFGFLSTQTHCQDLAVGSPHVSFRYLLVVLLFCAYSRCKVERSVQPPAIWLARCFFGAVFLSLSSRWGERAALQLEDEWSSSAVGAIH